jgi:hypothetical protein
VILKVRNEHLLLKSILHNQYGKQNQINFTYGQKVSIKRLMDVLPEQVKQLRTIVHHVSNDLSDNFDARDQCPIYPTIKEGQFVFPHINSFTSVLI